MRFSACNSAERVYFIWIDVFVSCQSEVTMKKLFYLLAVLFVGITSALMTSCSKSDKDKPLIVACEAASSPYCYYLNTNVNPPVAGIDVDLVEEIGKALGRPVQFNTVPFQNVFTLDRKSVV